MRIRTIGQYFAVVVAVLLSSCDTRTPTAGTPNSHVQIAIPKFLGGRDNVAAQVSGSTDDNGPHIQTARVRISVVGASRNLLDRNFDVSTLCNNGDSGDSQTACTLVVDFPIDDVADGATLQFQVDALDASGVIQYQIGPTTFTLNSNHSGGSVQSTARYVGVGNDATGVTITPRSLSLTVGAAAGTLGCSATGGTATTAQRPSIPLSATSSNPSVATVRFTTAGISVTPVAAGTAQITCELDFGSHASDAVTVTVAAAGGGTGALAVTVTNGGSPLSGATVEVRPGANNTTSTGPLTQVTPANGVVSFSNLAPSAYTIRVVAPGFVDNIQNVAVFAGQTFQATAAMQTAAPGSIQGTVRNSSTQALLSGVVVELRAGSNVTTGATVGSPVVTTAAGQYAYTSVPPGTYTIRATASGFSDNVQTTAVVAGQPTTLNLNMVASAGGNGGIQGTVTDSRTGTPIANAVVELRSGTNVTTGPTVGSPFVTISTGIFAFPTVPAGAYTVRVTANGFADLPINVTVVSGQTATVTASMSNCLAGTVCIVLTWGAFPPDLDGHLILPNSAGEINFSNPGSCTSVPFACQDIDAVNGFGPETIRITQTATGTYQYYVNDFYDSFEVPNPTGSNFAQSGARVDVYFGPTLKQSFNVPNQPGINWTVFNLSGTTITPVNTMSTVTPVFLVDGPSSLRSGKKKLPPPHP